MPKYKHIFFDLDHTLWDYDANATASLNELYATHGLDRYGQFLPEQMVATFFEVNYELWELYNAHKIGKEDIRSLRFPRIFEKMQVPLALLPNGFEDEYVALCPTKSKTFPHAHDILTYLGNKYELHIITNGFNTIQKCKLESADLAKFFSKVVTSESSQARKPPPKIFEFAFQLTGASAQDSLMIGDNLTSDIAGARNVNMDYIWFNPAKQKTNFEIQSQIVNLLSLKDLL